MIKYLFLALTDVFSYINSTLWHNFRYTISLHSEMRYCNYRVVTVQLFKEISKVDIAVKKVKL